MKFETEIELVNVLRDHLTKNYKVGDNIKIFEEVSLGFGIADLVVTNFVSDISTVSNSHFKLDVNDINIYDLISKNINGISFEKLIEILRTNKSSINNSLNKLYNDNFIIEKDSKFFINKEYVFPFKNNFAIEAKLKDWKRALKQAYRYKWFAEYSFVVIDEYYSKKAIENIDIFKKYNVGLATLSSEKVFKKHYYPKSETPLDTKMKMLMSEMVIHHELAK
jgi:predicted transcriptional regulator